MLELIGNGLANRLAERWANVVVLPATLFWLGGLFAWTATGYGALDWSRVSKYLTSPPSAATLGLIALGILVSGLFVRRLSDPVLALLSGRWPLWCDPAARVLARRWARTIERRERRWQELAAGPRDWAGERRFVALDAWLRTMPADTARCLPTRLGNALAAAERWPREKYGLDAAKCWARLWLVMPEDSRREMVRGQERLEAHTTAWTWGLLFVLWTPWAWWAAPVGLVAAFFAYTGAVRSAIVLGGLQEAAFDLHRTALYKALRILPPADTALEPAMGEKVTKYLWRGTEDVNLIPD